MQHSCNHLQTTQHPQGCHLRIWVKCSLLGSGTFTCGMSSATSLALLWNHKLQLQPHSAQALGTVFLPSNQLINSRNINLCPKTQITTITRYSDTVMHLKAFQLYTQKACASWCLYGRILGCPGTLSTTLSYILGHPRSL